MIGTTTTITTKTHGDRTVYTWANDVDRIEFTARPEGLRGVLLHRGEEIAHGSWYYSSEGASLEILRDSVGRLEKVGVEEFSGCGWARVRKTDRLFNLYDHAEAAGQLATLRGLEAEALVAQSITVVDDPRDPEYEQTFVLTTDGRAGSFEEAWFDPFDDVTTPALLHIINDDRFVAAVTERIEAEEISYRAAMDAVRAAVSANADRHTA